MNFPVLVVALVGVVVGQVAAKCPLNYVTGPRNFCFRFYEVRQNWDEAAATCRREGGHLANPSTQEVYSFLQQRIESNPNRPTIAYKNAFILFGPKHVAPVFTKWGDAFWIGGRKVNGVFTWTDGSPVQGHWIEGEPDNGRGFLGISFAGSEDCMTQLDSNNGWNDDHCANKMRFICQRGVVNPCNSKPCRNGGKCHPNGEDFSCECGKAYSGKTCQVANPCLTKSMKCYNLGKCQWDGVKATCKCAPGFKGANCGTRADPCVNAPCKNGGVCSSHGLAFTCKCSGAFSGVTCEKKCRHVVTSSGVPEKLDAMFLLDVSSSVTPANYERAKNFIGKVVEKMSLGAHKGRVAFDQFNHRFQELIHFRDSFGKGKEGLVARIRHSKKQPGFTLTGSAVEKAAKEFLHEARMSEKDVAKSLFVFVDGPTDRYELEMPKIKKYTQMLREKGVEIFVVGIGNEVSVDELNAISGGNDDHVFMADNFDALDVGFLAKIVEKECS